MKVDSSAQEAARIIWEWLPIRDTVGPADMIFVLGNKSDALPDEAAKLYKQGLAPLIVLSGGFGRLTKDDPLTEADRYMRALDRLGVPKSAMVLERESTNTGENIAFTKRLLAGRGITPQKAIAVTTALLSRRHQASLHKAWPEVTWLIDTPPATPFAERMAMSDADIFLDLIAGEVDRLQYYPAHGFMEQIGVPERILQARDLLAAAGHTRFLVKAR